MGCASAATVLGRKIGSVPDSVAVVNDNDIHMIKVTEFSKGNPLPSGGDSLYLNKGTSSIQCRGDGRFSVDSTPDQVTSGYTKHAFLDSQAECSKALEIIRTNKTVCIEADFTSQKVIEISYRDKSCIR